MRFLTVAALAALAACAPAEPVRTASTPDQPQAIVTASAGQALQTADCEAKNPSNLYLVRVGDNRGNLAFYAMAWSARPPTPQAVAASCLVNPQGPGTQGTSTTRPEDEYRPRRRL